MQKVFIVSVFLHKIHCISIYIYIILQVSHRCVGPRVEIYIRSRPSLFFFFFLTSFTVRKCLVSRKDGYIRSQPEVCPLRIQDVELSKRSQLA